MDELTKMYKEIMEEIKVLKESTNPTSDRKWCKVNCCLSQEQEDKKTSLERRQKVTNQLKTLQKNSRQPSMKEK